jgi:phospholipid-binding lipoprotein MlaA
LVNDANLLYLFLEKITMRLHLTVSLLAVLFATPALCQPDPATAVSQRDPWEGYNRWMFNANMSFDKVTLKPLAKGFKAVAPKFVQSGYANVFSNIAEPWTFANAVLQGKPDASFRTLGRFLINSTIGLGGLFNVAGKWGVQKDQEDVGQTLAVWGVPSGPYLMLPGFGPSNPRDAVGRIVKIIYEPINLVISKEVSSLAGLGQTGAELFNTRVGLLSTADPILDKSEDPYVTTRSAWYQNRTYNILDGNVPSKAGDDLFEDNGNAPETAPTAPTPPAPQASNTLQNMGQTTGDLCVAHDCSPAELDMAMRATRAGTSSEAAVAEALHAAR